jgi:hypothetical protein
MKGVQNAQMQGPQPVITGTLDTRDPHWMTMAAGGGMTRDGLPRT